MSFANLFAYIIGIGIPLFAVYIMYSFDLFETGKASTLLICLAWGGFSVLLALQVNNFVLGLTNYEITVRVLAPIIEELIKSVMLFIFVTRPRFRYIVDGAVYGFASGIGFAVIENILYIRNNPSAALGLAVARALSTSLMHATTSALIGIALGHLRRSTSNTKFIWALGGFVPAILIHIGYNNIVNVLDGTTLLLVAIGIGVMGFALISYQMRRGVTEEKKRFSQTLGIGVGVTDSERRAVQELGGNAIENILAELGAYFGQDKADAIRRLLVLQANIGILQNNLSAKVSDRLRKAWEAEIAGKRAEMDVIRHALGLYVMSFVRGVFPDEDVSIAEALKKEYTQFDPTQVHTFDMFVNAGKLSGALDPDKVAATADLLSQVEIFREVPIAELENLSRAITVGSYNAGQSLFNQGDMGDTMFIVEDGQIGIFIRDGGSEKQISLMQPGDLVGELALIDGSPRSARAKANSDLRVLVLRRDHFLMFIRSRPNVLLALLEYLARRARRLSDLVEQSVEWASRITQEDYDGAMEIAKVLQPAGFNIPAPRAALRSSIIAHLPAAEATDHPSTMGGVFAKMSSALEERDSSHSLPAANSKNTRGLPLPTLPDAKEKPTGSGLFARLNLEKDKPAVPPTPSASKEEKK